MTTLREAAQQALEALEGWKDDAPSQWSTNDEKLITTLRAALEQPEQGPTVKESLMIPQHIADQLTTADLAWLETRRLVRVWKELGQLRWVGVGEGWNLAIEAVRDRLDKECQDVLAWKDKADASGETAVQLLKRMRGERNDHTT